jgi:CRISPR/Cas system-associated exonuclease Cas4 (RecB family)
MAHLPVVQPGTLFTSVSQIKTFLLCPRRFEFRYVRGLAPAFIPVALAFGTAFHSALARFYSGMQSKKAAPELELLEQTFRDSWAQQLKGKAPLQVDDDEDLGAVIDLAVRMLRAFYTYAAGTLVEVEAIETPFTAELFDPVNGEVLDETLVGVLDLVLREGDRRVIVEHKTSAKKFSQEQLDTDPQMSGYAFAANQLGWADTGLRYSIVTKTKSPAVQVENVLRGPLAENDFLRTVVGVLRSIDAGVSYPVRGWQCRSCPFAEPCQTLGGSS